MTVEPTQSAIPVTQAAGSLDYRVSWPRPATPCDLVPLWKGEFRDFNDWVSFATTRLTGTTDASGREIKAVCIDALGRRCSIGADFMRARDENAFPVRYFWECVSSDVALQARKEGEVQGMEKAAGIAEAYSAVNFEQAGDTVLLDPVLRGRGFTTENIAESERQQTSGLVHASQAHAGQHIATAIREASRRDQ